MDNEGLVETTSTEPSVISGTEPGASAGIDTGDLPVGSETPEVETFETTEEPQPEITPETAPERAPAEETREPLPAALSKAVRELRSAHPEHADVLKQLNNTYYANREYRSVFPSVDDARTAKSTIESLGGHEGIAAMRSEIAGIRQMDEWAAQGDPRVLSTLAEAAPDGFKRLIPEALKLMEHMDKPAFDEMLSKPFYDWVEGSGLAHYIKAALDELKGGNADRTSQILERLHGFTEGLKQRQVEIQNRYHDPRLDQLEKREQAQRGKERDILRTHAQRELDNYIAETMEPQIQSLIKGRGLSAEAVKDFRQGILAEIDAILKSPQNKHFQDTRESLLWEGDLNRIVTVSKPYYDQARRSAVNTVWNRRYGSLPQPTRTRQRPAAPTTNAQAIAAAPKEAAEGAPIPLPKKPSTDELDFSKDPTFAMYIAGRGYLKNSGKLVSWKTGGK